MGDADVTEKHLVELRPAGHLAEGAHLDAGRVHVQHELGQPGVLGRIGIGASQQDGHVRHVTTRCPDLLPIDDPVVTVAFGPR